MFLIDFLCFFFRFSTVVEVAEDLISFTDLLVPFHNLPFTDKVSLTNEDLCVSTLADTSFVSILPTLFNAASVAAASATGSQGGEGAGVRAVVTSSGVYTPSSDSGLIESHGKKKFKYWAPCNNM